jgi:uncharacterized RDD family membrane protein YckC
MTMADDNWYYAQNNQQLGPVTLAALRSMVANGQVGAADLVWTQGMAQWTPARSVPEVGSVLLGGAGAGHGGVGNPVAAPTGYPPVGGAPGQLGYGVGQTYYQQQYTGYNIEYAGFWLRFCAAFIDGIIIGIPFFILGFAVEAMYPSTPGPRGMPTQNPAAVGISLALNLLQIVVSWLYYAYQESSPKQATLGKQAVGIKVTDLDGQPIGFGQATGRYFAKILSFCTIYIGFIMAAFTEKKQGLHDMIAGTLVVKK